MYSNTLLKNLALKTLTIASLLLFVSGCATMSNWYDATKQAVGNTASKTKQITVGLFGSTDPVNTDVTAEDVAKSNDYRDIANALKDLNTVPPENLAFYCVNMTDGKSMFSGGMRTKCEEANTRVTKSLGETIEGQGLPAELYFYAGQTFNGGRNVTFTPSRSGYIYATLKPAVLTHPDYKNRFDF